MESKRAFDLHYPDDWTPVDPPDGAIAVIVAPDTTNGFTANLVVTVTDLPTDMLHSIDQYVWEAISGLNLALTDPSIKAIWVTEPCDPEMQLRLVVRHQVEGIAVEMVQHHTWLDEEIVVITLSKAIGQEPDIESMAMIDVCLLSAAAVNTAKFVDWKPAEMFAVWSPAPGTDRIAHL